jgi:CheY-like chemotaxis protein
MPSAILCVDDNQLALHARKLVLESAGHQVQTAFTATAARELMVNRQFDLAIVDYYLEGISGDELAAVESVSSRHSRDSAFRSRRP